MSTFTRVLYRGRWRDWLIEREQRDGRTLTTGVTEGHGGKSYPSHRLRKSQPSRKPRRVGSLALTTEDTEDAEESPHPNVAKSATLGWGTRTHTRNGAPLCFLPTSSSLSRWLRGHGRSTFSGRRRPGRG